MDGKGKVTKFDFSVRRVRDWRAVRQISFDQGWRAMRDRFYDESLNDRDWEAIRRKYRPVAAECLDHFRRRANARPGDDLLVDQVAVLEPLEVAARTLVVDEVGALEDAAQISPLLVVGSGDGAVAVAGGEDEPCAAGADGQYLGADDQVHHLDVPGVSPAIDAKDQRATPRLGD